MKNIAIKCLSTEQGKKIIQYLLSLGAKNESDYGGTNINAFYFISEKTGNITLSHANSLPLGYSIIELPKEEQATELKRGDEILVRDTIVNYEKRIFLAYIEGARSPVVTVAKGDESNFKQGKPFSTVQWRYYKRIEEEEQIVELTMEDISNGKGVGIKPELIRIKK